MRWLDTPPVTNFKVITQTKAHLRLEGPTTSARVAGGVMGGFGAAFAAMGARALRVPFPMPWRLIPVGMTLVGAGLTAAGAANLLVRCSIDVKKSGLTFAWHFKPVAERSLEVRTEDLEALEIVTEETSSREHYSVQHVLTLVKRDGTAMPFEHFVTRAQANLRKQAIEAVTLG